MCNFTSATEGFKEFWGNPGEMSDEREWSSLGANLWCRSLVTHQFPPLQMEKEKLLPKHIREEA